MTKIIQLLHFLTISALLLFQTAVYAADKLQLRKYNKEKQLVAQKWDMGELVKYDEEGWVIYFTIDRQKVWLFTTETLPQHPTLNTIVMYGRSSAIFRICAASTEVCHANKRRNEMATTIRDRLKAERKAQENAQKILMSELEEKFLRTVKSGEKPVIEYESYDEALYHILNIPGMIIEIKGDYVVVNDPKKEEGWFFLKPSDDIIGAYPQVHSNSNYGHGEDFSDYNIFKYEIKQQDGQYTSNWTYRCYDSDLKCRRTGFLRYYMQGVIEERLLKVIQPEKEKILAQLKQAEALKLEIAKTNAKIAADERRIEKEQQEAAVIERFKINFGGSLEAIMENMLKNDDLTYESKDNLVEFTSVFDPVAKFELTYYIFITHPDIVWSPTIIMVYLEERKGYPKRGVGYDCKAQESICEENMEAIKEIQAQYAEKILERYHEIKAGLKHNDDHHERIWTKNNLEVKDDASQQESEFEW